MHHPRPPAFERKELEMTFVEDFVFESGIFFFFFAAVCFFWCAGVNIFAFVTKIVMKPILALWVDGGCNTF